MLERDVRAQRADVDELVSPWGANRVTRSPISSERSQIAQDLTTVVRVTLTSGHSDLNTPEA